MSRRRCTPAQAIASAAALRGVRGPRRGRGPRPTTVRTRPPSVSEPPPARPTCRRGRRARRRPRALVEPVDRVAARRRRRVARAPPGRSPTAARRAGSGPAEPGAAARAGAPSAAASRSGPSGDGEPRQDGLRLRVAEADVELEQARAVGGQHQAGVEGAAERRAAPGQLGQDRPVDRSRGSRSTAVVVEVGQRRVGAHAAGVRPASPSPSALVVAGRRQRHGRRGRRRSR